MLKKIFAITLCFVYFFAAAGVSINVHYCGGEVEEVSFFSYGEKSCCCGNEAEAGCCKDELSYIKLNDSHQHSAPAGIPTCEFVYLEAISSPLALQLLTAEKELQTASISPHGPPLDSKLPVFLKIQRLLI